MLSKFDSEGNPSPFSALGPGVNSIPIPNLYGFAGVVVDNSGTSTQGQIYAFGEGQPAHVFAPDGTELGGNFPLQPPGGTCAGAVGPQGDFWWASYRRRGLRLQLRRLPAARRQQPRPRQLLCPLAINSAAPPSPTSGYFYVPELRRRPTHRSSTRTATFKYHSTSAAPWGLAVDPGTGNIYANNFDHVTEWAPSTTETPGPQVSTFGYADPLHGFPNGMSYCGRGIDVNRNTHRVYVADCSRVIIFGPGEALIIPTVTTEGADVTQTTAVLHGTASTDGGGDTTECHFEWGNDENYGNTAPCASPSGPIHDADGTVPVTSPELKNLNPGQIYHYRLVVSNPNGVSRGADRTFRPRARRTSPAPSPPKSTRTRCGSTATIDPAGADTRYRIEYGPTTAYGQSIPLPDFKIVDNQFPIVVSHIVPGLVPGATYHYRFVAYNSFGTADSGDHEFTTYRTDVIDDQLRQRARPQADADVAAARLPRLRAGLRARRGRL